jgi:hypothetical protein
VTAALANKTNVNPRACADTSGQTTGYGYFQFSFYINIGVWSTGFFLFSQ